MNYFIISTTVMAVSAFIFLMVPVKRTKPSIGIHGVPDTVIQGNTEQRRTEMPADLLTHGSANSGSGGSIGAASGSGIS